MTHSHSHETSRDDEGAWLSAVRNAVDGRLRQAFDEARRDVERLAPEARPVLDALEDLTMRGGKRLRPAMLVAAQSAIDERASVERVLAACAALEVLQSYLLIHDDWMDGDEERRGGPAAHVLLRRELGARGAGEAGIHLSASLAVLSGDLGCALANDLFLESARLSPRGLDAMVVFVRVQRDVVFGQTLDLLGSADVARMHALKTGSYTVEGPLVLGALLAGADEVQLRSFREVAIPLGEAFQIKDDLLGTFGDSAKTGKPAGNDLRVGKHNAVVEDCLAHGGSAARAALERVLGRPDATERDVAACIAALVEDGVPARVATRLSSLIRATEEMVARAPISALGASRIVQLARLIASREN